MKKVYNITLCRFIIKNSVGLIVILVVLLFLHLVNPSYSYVIGIEEVVLVFSIIAVISALPLYVMITYYRHDRDVAVVIDEKNMQLDYRKGGKVQIVPFNEIMVVKIYEAFRWYECYYCRIVIKTTDPIVLTSLIANSDFITRIEQFAEVKYVKWCGIPFINSKKFY